MNTESKYIVSSDYSEHYSTQYYRLSGNMLEVKTTEIRGSGEKHLYPVTIWKPLKELK